MFLATRKGLVFGEPEPGSEADECLMDKHVGSAAMHKAVHLDEVFGWFLESG